MLVPKTLLKFFMWISPMQLWFGRAQAAAAKTSDTKLYVYLITLITHNFHGQGLSCWMYAQQLKQAQENYQNFTLKDNLDYPFHLWWSNHSQYLVIIFVHPWCWQLEKHWSNTDWLYSCLMLFQFFNPFHLVHDACIQYILH